MQRSLAGLLQALSSVLFIRYARVDCPSVSVVVGSAQPKETMSIDSIPGPSSIGHVSKARRHLSRREGSVIQSRFDMPALALISGSRPSFASSLEVEVAGGFCC
jgi:hypothetical protein